MIRGIRARIALALLLVVGGATGAAYLVAVPSLERRLVDAKLKQIERDATALAVDFPAGSPFAWQNWAEQYAPAVNARVVVYALISLEPPVLFVRGDSRTFSSRDVEHDSVAAEAAARGGLRRGTTTRGGADFAEVAVRLSDEGPVILLSAPLGDADATVSLVRRRLLGAGALALAVALALGLTAAALHARRIRRLERAAERIADGRFDQPVVDGGRDELGQLADAFERMRVRLAQLDRARGEFIANASHELRTPLFSLGGFLELLADEELDEETRREFLATMREQVERLTKLATDLLDLSRLAAGHLVVEREEVALGAVARALVEEFRVRAEQTAHALELRCDEGATALADEQRVLQIGRILVENALRHTPGGTRVAVSCAPPARLAVADDGPGIPPEHAEHIFDRFYRVEGDRASGSGLGLAIASELARLMEGSLTLRSQPGSTVFTLELARAPAGARERERVFT